MCRGSSHEPQSECPESLLLGWTQTLRLAGADTGVFARRLAGKTSLASAGFPFTEGGRQGEATRKPNRRGKPHGSAQRRGGDGTLSQEGEGVSGAVSRGAPPARLRAGTTQGGGISGCRYAVNSMFAIAVEDPSAQALELPLLGCRARARALHPASAGGAAGEGEAAAAAAEAARAPATPGPAAAGGGRGTGVGWGHPRCLPVQPGASATSLAAPRGTERSRSQPACLGTPWGRPGARRSGPRWPCPVQLQPQHPASVYWPPWPCANRRQLKATEGSRALGEPPPPPPAGLPGTGASAEGSGTQPCLCSALLLPLPANPHS